MHSIAIDSKGNIYTTETWEGKRLQKFVYKGLAAGHDDASGHRLAAADLRALSRRQHQRRAATPRTAAAIIRLRAAIESPPSSVGGIVAKPMADAFR